MSIRTWWAEKLEWGGDRVRNGCSLVQERRSRGAETQKSILQNKLGGEREEGGDPDRKAEKDVLPGQEGSRWSSAPCISAAVHHVGSSVLGQQGQLLCLSLRIQGFLSPDVLQGMVQSWLRWAAVSLLCSGSLDLHRDQAARSRVVLVLGCMFALLRAGKILAPGPTYSGANWTGPG